MEPLKLHNPSPLSPSAILAHLRQNVRPIRLQSPRSRNETPEPCGSSETSRITNNETPSGFHTPHRDILDSQPEQSQETPKKIIGILKDSKRSIFFQSVDRSNSTSIIDKRALEDSLAKLQSDSAPQSIENDTFKKRNNVVKLPCSLEGSRPSSKRKNLSVGNSKDFQIRKKEKKVAFSPDTRDHGISCEMTPMRVRRPIPPLKNFLKEDLELESTDIFTPKPMFLNSPLSPLVENKVRTPVKIQERKQHPSPFNINIKQRILREQPESPRKGSLNNPNLELISTLKDPTPSGRSCTPKQSQRHENSNPVTLSPIIVPKLKAPEEVSSFFSPRSGSLSARNNFNVNLTSNVLSQKNSLITERSGSREGGLLNPEKLKASDFNFYNEILKKNKLAAALDKPFRHNSLQSDSKITKFVIQKKDTARSVFSSTERLGLLNALRPRDIRLDP